MARFLEIFTPSPNHPGHPFVIVWMLALALGVFVLAGGTWIAVVVTRRHTAARTRDYLVGPIIAIIGLGVAMLGGWLTWTS